MNYIKKETKNISKYDQDVVDRFWSHVKTTNDDDSCWEFSNAYDKDGYGVFGAKDLEGKLRSFRASRFAWITTKSEIPTGLQVLHTCHNRKCVRPSHLRLGTARDNGADKSKAGRSYGGQKHHSAKLTFEQVQIIRGMHKLKTGTLAEIGNMFKISAQNVYAICSGKSWKVVA